MADDDTTNTTESEGADKPAGAEAAAGGEQSKAETVDQPDLGTNQVSSGKNSIDFLLDVPLNLSVELGRAKMLVHDLLQLGQGSVIELTKIVGEPLEVLVNDKLIARGEVVTLNEKFAVRLTDIISPSDRIDSLSE